MERAMAELGTRTTATSEAERSTEPLRNLFLSVSTMSSLVSSMRDLPTNPADGAAGKAQSLARAADMVALTIAVETLLFVEQGEEGVEVSDWMKRLAGLTLGACTRLSQSIKETMRHIKARTAGDARSPLEGALENAGCTIGRLRDVLTFLCCSWVVAEISAHAQ